MEGAGGNLWVIGDESFPLASAVRARGPAQGDGVLSGSESTLHSSLAGRQLPVHRFPHGSNATQRSVAPLPVSTFRHFSFTLRRGNGKPVGSPHAVIKLRLEFFFFPPTHSCRFPPLPERQRWFLSRLQSSGLYV